MFKKGSFSRLILGTFVILSFAIGGIAQMRSVQDAATLTNAVRDTGEDGAGVLAGSLSGGGDRFDKAFNIAAAPSADKPTEPDTTPGDTPPKKPGQ